MNAVICLECGVWEVGESMHGVRARAALRLICKPKWYHHDGGETLTGLSETAQNLKTIKIDFRKPGTNSNLQKQIVEALCLGDRRKASDLLLDYGGTFPSLKADDFLYIFKHCAQSPDPLFVMEIWRLMEAKDISLNKTCSILLTQALCAGGYFEEAFDMIDVLGERQDNLPFLYLYNTLLGFCIEKQSIVHASKCLEMMEKKMLGKNEVTYIQLVKLAVLQKNLHAVRLIWEDYIKHYSLSITLLRKFIWSFIRLADLESAYKILQVMVSLATKGNISIARTADAKLFPGKLVFKKDEGMVSWICPPFAYFPDSTCASIDQQSILMGNKEAKSAELDGLNAQRDRVLMWSFNDVIHGCAQHRKFWLAGKLIFQMQHLGLQPSSHTYDGFVRAVVAKRGYKGGMEVLKKMQQNNLKPYVSTLATLSISCSKALQLDLAEALLDQIPAHPYLRPYNALLEACDAMNQPERAVRVFAKMMQRKVVPDIMTYELLFSLFVLVNAPYEDGDMLSKVVAAKRINAIERDMAKNGIQHSHKSMKNLLRALGEEGMISELVEYLHVAENIILYRNPYLRTDIYNIVLHYLVEAKESHLAIEIFKTMKKFGCHTSSATYNIMIDCCSSIGCYKSASLLVSMMIREGFYLRTCTYTALIKILLEDWNLNEALLLLERVRLSGIGLDVLLFNIFLKHACFKGRIDIIEYIVEYMHRVKVQPDPASCRYVFSAYVDSGFHNTAIEAFQVLSLRMMSEDGNILGKNKKFLDEFILAEDSDAESRILKLFEDSEERLSMGLLNLRWCALAGFPICESADRSLWAKRLELKFNKPLVPGSMRG